MTKKVRLNHKGFNGGCKMACSFVVENAGDKNENEMIVTQKSKHVKRCCCRQTEFTSNARLK